VGTGSEVDTSVAVVGRVVGVVRAGRVIGVVAVVTTDQGRLEDELAVIVDGESIARAGQISNAEDSRADRDKVVGLADGRAGSTKVELVPATIDVKMDRSASVMVIVLVAVIVMLMAIIVVMLVATLRAALRALGRG
jgi:hypothetical protein